MAEGFLALSAALGAGIPQDVSGGTAVKSSYPSEGLRLRLRVEGEIVVPA